jgi:beta-N-acetylhexosaminidase
VTALNAGVDYIVIAYDPDLYYVAMYDLLQAYEAGDIDTNQLNASQQRIQFFLEPTQ